MDLCSDKRSVKRGTNARTHAHTHARMRAHTHTHTHTLIQSIIHCRSKLRLLIIAFTCFRWDFWYCNMVLAQMSVRFGLLIQD